MGNFFQAKPQNEQNKSLFRYLKTKSIDDISLVISYINDQYIASTALTYDEFEDIYKEYLQEYCEKAFIILDNEGTKNGRVDIFESMAFIVIYCIEEFPIKLRFLFDLFDFDKSGNIEKKEIVLTCQTTVRTICKASSVVPPDIKILEDYAARAFHSVDIDMNQQISYSEFEDWVCREYGLQDFLLRHASIQTFTNTQRRCTERVNEFIEAFHQAAGNSQKCDIDKLISNVSPILQKKQIALFNEALRESSKSYSKLTKDEEQKVKYKSYLELIQAWSSFDASDINNDDTLSLSELPFLFCGYNESIPTTQEIMENLKKMDKDKSGDITRQEWLLHLNLVKNSGKTVFQAQLKREFLKLMKQVNNKINEELVSNFIIKNFSEYVSDQEELESRTEQAIQELEEDIKNWKQVSQLIKQIALSYDELKQFA